MTVQRRSQVGERKIFSTMGFGESSRGIVAEIADMRFPNNRLRNRHFRHAIGIPTFGIGARQVDDHASTAVHASRVRPWIGNAIDGTAIAFNQKNRNISRVYYRQNRKSKSHRPRDASKNCPIKASPSSPLEPRENNLNVIFSAVGAQMANWVPDCETTAPSGRSRQSGNGSATLVFGCSKLFSRLFTSVIASPFSNCYQPLTEPDMDS